MTAPSRDAIFQSQPEEHAFRITNVTGTVPADLSGTFLRSGPGLMEVGDAQLNFFDGHALLAGVSFANGAATFRSRFVRTPISDAVMGSRYRFAWFPTRSGEARDGDFFAHFDTVCRVDVETGETRTWNAGAFVSPVAFVARPGATAEDDGWLLVWLMRQGGSAIAVLDAQGIENGPVATLDLGIHLPGISHTRWAANVQLA